MQTFSQERGFVEALLIPLSSDIMQGWTTKSLTSVRREMFRDFSQLDNRKIVIIIRSASGVSPMQRCIRDRTSLYQPLLNSVCPSCLVCSALLWSASLKKRKVVSLYFLRLKWEIRRWRALEEQRRGAREAGARAPCNGSKFSSKIHVCK